ncbi:MAG TPA: VWA domain-containing protein [Spirochaetota bacterium]|nr:VWA domain-containing protein [Spirochaetota bacterium]HPL16358.1 VWA domain-containing protein [Spirochaetota bacterium]HQJ70445.1 VWA domain-containing protein [Spirochaetota bacterium]HRS78660.1 VWA domain-containing protein [Spirochaetota bacterium]HRT76689.1 VWA domain-containing protein [Spirochaetota bacterium]
MAAAHDASAIQTKIYEFMDVLRDASINISSDEVLSLFHALSHISLLDKSVFRQTLKTTLVKDYTDIPIFDRCFDEFFSGGGDPQIDVVNAFREMHARDTVRERGGMTPEEMAGIEEALADFIDRLPDEILFERSPEEILNLMIDELAQAESSGGLGQMLFNVRNRNRAAAGSGQRAEEGPDDMADIVNALSALVNRRQSSKKIGTQIRDREDYLLNKPIYQIKPEEIREMRELIKRFGQKLKNRISLRKKRVKHGGIDIKRTLRTSLQYGGVPFKIFRKDRRIDRPQLVVMCDISGSVNQYSRFMLLLAYTLQSLFSKVRSFAFISNIVEITPLFMEMDPERALNSIFEDTNFTYGWGSNYGRCFDNFMKDYSDSLTRKTTVLVLGDGRNNHQDPGLDSFIRIRERSRNLLWLNPDRKHLWNWADSIAYLYREYCDEMKEVNNFLDLSEFIDKLFLDL